MIFLRCFVLCVSLHSTQSTQSTLSTQSTESTRSFWCTGGGHYDMLGILHDILDAFSSRFP